MNQTSFFKAFHESYLELFFSKKLDQCFKENSVEEIIHNLRSVNDDWTKKLAVSMEKMSPISMKITLEMLRRGKEMSLKDCLAMEYRLVRRCCEDSDFYEGMFYFIKQNI